MRALPIRERLAGERSIVVRRHDIEVSSAMYRLPDFCWFDWAVDRNHTRPHQTRQVWRVIERAPHIVDGTRVDRLVEDDCDYVFARTLTFLPR